MKTLLAALLMMASVPVVKPGLAPVRKSDREKVLAAASTQVGVVEKTGSNDGEVEKYLVATGLGAKSAAPYCACFVFWCGMEALGAGNPYPKSAWSPDMVRGGTRTGNDLVIRGGETFGIYFPAKGRVAHTGLVERREGAYLVTIEGNTSGNARSGSAADRDGQGVFRKRRLITAVYSTRDWIKAP